MDTSEEFNALLDESYVVISGQDRATAVSKLNSAQRWVTRCINKSITTRALIKKTCPEGQEATWKPAVVNAQCDVLLGDRDRLHRQMERYTIWSDAVTEITDDETMKEAQRKKLADTLKLVESEDEQILSYLAQYHIKRPASAAGASAVTASAAPTVKPEKELKPDKQLDVSDTARDFERWLEQYAVYHARSNFALAKPVEQRSFLSRCMTDALWRRATASEEAAEADLPLDPTNLKSGIFYHLLGCFSASDPLLGKRANIFSEKLGRQKHTGQGRYESYPVFYARLSQRLYECDFDNMTIEQVKQALIIHMISDPGLISKVMETTNPTPKVQHMICMRYADTLQKTSAIESTLSAASVNATRMSRTCVRCNANHPTQRAMCKPCFADSKKPADKRTRIKNLTCTICRYTGHHVTAACNETNKKMVFVEKGEKANSQQAKHQAPRQPQAGRRPQGRRGPTHYSGKAAFNPQGKGTANAVHTSEPRDFEHISDSGSEDDDTRSFTTAVSRAHDIHETHTYATNSVRVTRNLHLAPSHNGIYYKVDGPHVPGVLSERHWRLKCMARNKHNRPRALSFGRGNTQPEKSIFSHMQGFFKRLISLTLFFLSSIMGKTSTLPSAPIVVNSIRIMPAYANLSVSRVAPNSNSLSQAEFCPELDNMSVLLGNTLVEKRRHNRVRTTLSACPDTGSARSICAPVLATRLGARIHGKERVNIIAANGSGMANAGSYTQGDIRQHLAGR